MSNEKTSTCSSIKNKNENSNKVIKAQGGGNSLNSEIDNFKYKMDSRPCGYCLIVKNLIGEFNDSEMNLNINSDVAKISEIFKEFHFKVEFHHTKSAEEIRFVFEKYSKRVELLKHDTFVAIVLSYGNIENVPHQSIVERYNNVNCPALLNKPKLFFFSFCRGDMNINVNDDIFQSIDLYNDVTDNASLQEQEMAIERTNPTSEARSESVRKFNPISSDIMIFTSIINGYLNCIDKTIASLFGRSLIEALTEFSKDHDLLYILTQISHKMSEKQEESKIKQFAQFDLYGFKRFFYFNHEQDSMNLDASKVN